jgi:hypothetical protein
MHPYVRPPSSSFSQIEASSEMAESAQAVTKSSIGISLLRIFLLSERRKSRVGGRIFKRSRLKPKIAF